MRRAFVLILLLTALTETLPSQEMSVPVNLQYTLFMKVLGFDRALHGRNDQEIVVGILYQSKFRASARVKEELMSIAEASGMKLNDTVVRWRAIDISDESDPKASLMGEKIDILYVAPLRSVGIDALASTCRARKIRTLTGVSDFVEGGLAVGIGIKGEKPQIEINLAAAKAEGADFTSQLLKVARIVE